LLSPGISAHTFDFDMALVVGLTLDAVSLIYLQTHAYQHHLRSHFLLSSPAAETPPVSLRIVLPDAIEVLDDTRWPTLTLVICYPFNYIGAAPKRFIVHAEMDPASPN
jgi:hypothetical protein